MGKILTRILTGLALAISSITAMADLTSDLSFGTGDYNGWTVGPTSGIKTGAYGSSGIGGATVTGEQTVSCCGPNTWTVTPYTGSYMVSLQASGGANYSNMTSGLGLSSTSVTALSTEINAQGTGAITSGVWITKSLTFNSAATFKMAWNYISTDYVPFNDGSLTSLVNTGSATTLGKINGVSTQYLLLGATNPGTGNYSTGSYGSTGWQWVNYEITTAGTYKIGFASFNQGDTSLSPVLFVNDGLGTTKKNGTIFNPVAPNDPTMPTTNSDGTVSTGGPSTPTVVSTASGTPTVASTSTNGDALTSNSVVYGSSAVAVALSNSKGAVTPKTLTVTQTTATTTTTPLVLTTTVTTPVTTTTTTTPVTVTTWSDGTTTTANGTPVVAVTVTDSVVTTASAIEEVQVVSTDRLYTTRIDQFDRLSEANTRENLLLTSDPLSRHRVYDSEIKIMGANVNDQTVFTVQTSGHRSNVQDGYSVSSDRYVLGLAHRVRTDLLVGAQISQSRINLSGNASTGLLDKNAVNVYSLWSKDDWLVKTDLGLARNIYNTSHTLAELDLANSARASGSDAWLAVRTYTPAKNGLRLFAGARKEQNRRDYAVDSGSALSAVDYNKINAVGDTTEAGVRLDHYVNPELNIYAEYAQNNRQISASKLGLSYLSGPRTSIQIGATQQRQNGQQFNGALAEVRISF